MSRRSSSLVLLVVLGTTACPKKPPPPPPPPPPMCARVERGGDEIVEEVRCSGQDVDEDGIDDAVDNCPDLLEVPNGVFDRDGCPDPDADEDGFADFEDACPREAGGPPDGCPLKDKDGDTLADHLDACPTEAEDVDGDQDSDGCPDGVVEVVEVRARDDQLWQAARVEVRAGRESPTKVGQESLEALVDAVLTRASDVTRVRVVAYASVREAARGRAKVLAKKRAERVAAALREAGVKPEAIELALYPLRGAQERVGRVDISVFLPLAKVLAPNEGASATTTATSDGDETAPGAKDAGEAQPAHDTTKPAEQPPDGKKSNAEWDAAVLPYPEPSQAPADEDWDL